MPKYLSAFTSIFCFLMLLQGNVELSFANAGWFCEVCQEPNDKQSAMLSYCLAAHESNLSQTNRISCELQTTRQGKIVGDQGKWFKDGLREKYAGGYVKSADSSTYYSFYVDFEKNVDRRLQCTQQVDFEKFTPANNLGCQAMQLRAGGGNSQFRPWQSMMIKFSGVTMEPDLLLGQFCSSSEEINISYDKPSKIYLLKGVRKYVDRELVINWSARIDKAKGFLCVEFKKTFNYTELGKTVVSIGVVENVVENDGVFFPTKTSWRTKISEDALETHVELRNFKTGEAAEIEETDLDLVFPKATILYVYDEAFPTDGKFKSKPELHIIGEDGKPSKIFRGDLNEYYDYLKELGLDNDQAASTHVVDENREQAQQNEGYDLLPWGLAYTLVGACVFSCVWILVRFIQTAVS